MKRNLLIVSAAFLIVALVSAPASAATPSAATLDRIFAVVKDIQSDMNIVLNKLTALQTNVATIKSRVAQPVRYEYCTTIPPSGIFNQYDNSLVYFMAFSNHGDTPAHVTYVICNTTNIVGGTDGPGTGSSQMTEIHNATVTIDGKSSKSFRYVNSQYPGWDETSGSPKFPILTVKITADSPAVTPRLTIVSESGNPVDRYLPGDFQRVEIRPE
jgi:hypothetical protein